VPAHAVGDLAVGGDDGHGPARRLGPHERPDQLVGGLAYYTRRRITLLEPPGFIPPDYLGSSVGSMFLSRAEFQRRWGSSAHLALVSDPQRHRDDPQSIASGPLQVLGRFGDRWVLTNSSATASR